MDTRMGSLIDGPCQSTAPPLVGEVTEGPDVSGDDQEVLGGALRHGLIEVLTEAGDIPRDTAGIGSVMSVPPRPPPWSNRLR
jgi:hypothetical protein